MRPPGHADPRRPAARRTRDCALRFAQRTPGPRCHPATARRDPRSRRTQGDRTQASAASRAAGPRAPWPDCASPTAPRRRRRAPTPRDTRTGKTSYEPAIDRPPVVVLKRRHLPVPRRPRDARATPIKTLRRIERRHLLTARRQRRHPARPAGTAPTRPSSAHTPSKCSGCDNRASADSQATGSQPHPATHPPAVRTASRAADRDRPATAPPPRPCPPGPSDQAPPPR